MKEFLLIWLFLSLLPFVAFTQNKEKHKADLKIEKSYKKALILSDEKAYKKAIKAFEKILKKQPDHINSCLKLSGIYYHLQNYSKAESMLIRAIRIDSLYNPEIYYSLAMIQEILEKRKEAMESYSKYIHFETRNEKKIKRAKRNISRLTFIVDAIAHPVKFEPRDPGAGINTSALEYLAAVNVANDYIIFTRRVRGQEDFFYSEKKAEKWTEAKPLYSLNTDGNEGVHCISADGKMIIYTSCERKDSYGSCDLYVSHLKKGDWSKPQNMGPEINTKYWDAQPSISSDSKTLYFSSTRPGGKGAKDLWVSRKAPDGRWKKPINAGDVLNTPFNEEAPFIHADNESLYFMSDGHPGMGGYDLFLSKKKNNHWSIPQNLGYPINTEFDEGALTVSPDGVTAFLSSDRIDLGLGMPNDLNIYSFELYPEISAKPVSYVRGVVTDHSTKKALRTKISLRDNKTGELIIEFNTDDLGDFLIALPLGVNYNLTIDEPGYVFHSENFQLTEPDSVYTPYFKKIELYPMESFVGEGQTEPEIRFVLHNVFFASGSSEIDSIQSAIELNNLLSLLREHKNITIEIAGHTDDVGSAEDNLRLSINRANSIYEFLISNGINAERLSYTGYGETKPIDSNSTKTGRKNNRRTEFLIVNSGNK